MPHPSRRGRSVTGMALEMRWEYRTCSTFVEAGEDLQSWLAKLNQLGAEGWETMGPIVLDFYGKTTSHRTLLLKRPVA